MKNLTSGNYYYQDASGSTSHLADSTGHLREWYRYDLQGTPFFYDANNNQRSASNYSVRHLFTGEQWYSELGLYDLRNRFYSPDIGRFLHPDPIGFWGGKNLYRYCRNNPVKWSDPSGISSGTVMIPIEVTDQPIYDNYDRPNPLGSIEQWLDSIPWTTGGGEPSERFRSENPEQMRMMERTNQWLSLASNPPNIPIPAPPPTPYVPPLSADPNEAAAVDITSDDIVAGLGVSLDLGGIIAGAAEGGLAGQDYWLSGPGYYSLAFHGNKYVRGYRLATRGSPAFGVAGRVFYAAQFPIAAIDVYQNPTAANITHQSINLTMGRVAFMGPWGFAAATGYFIINDFVGWDVVFQSYMEAGPYLINATE